MTQLLSSKSLPKQRQSWHTHSIDKTLELLQSNRRKGLTTSEVQQRLNHYGPNELTESAGRTNWQILIDQFKNIMLLMLIAVAIISGILDLSDLQSGKAAAGGVPFKDTIAILAIVILNGVLGYLQETRAEKALAALKALSSPKVQAIRDGRRLVVEAKTIVPGDIILLEAGSQVCADGQIIEASSLKVRESALTGEAEAVIKYPAKSGLEHDLPLGDRYNMVFTGTEVVNGRAKVVVSNTGMDTELGKIAQMLQSVGQEETPLQQRMTQLGNVLVTGSLILVAVVVLAGIVQVGPQGIRVDFSPLQDLLEVSLSMAVAVVPEGLPAVITVTLALGTQRMVKRHALIRKLPAVETLGSVNTICSDKTGTLTQNKMVVQEVQTLGEAFEVTGEGYSPTGEFFNSHQQSVKVSDRSEFLVLLVGCVLCNDALLSQERNEKHREKAPEWSIIGDPTEGALLVLAAKAGLSQHEINFQLERVWEFPFSSERKRMSIISQKKPEVDKPISEFSIQNSKFIMFTKGSPELILERCGYYKVDNNTLGLGEEQRRQILNTNNQMASRGLRVLGFAYKPLQEIPAKKSEEVVEQEMIWLGLVGMMDAPRAEVKLAVAKCKDAGITPVMITGDHPLTARAIAQKLGIANHEDRLLTGRDLENLSQNQLEREVDHVSIYARVSPEHKLRIVQALQKRGKFVAMTGDGVNDAPALKQADIGIAMGITGTDVSKEASDMVLLDDNFTTIVAATEEGRVVYSNIRRFIKYILGSNIGEVLTIAAAPLLGLPDVPLTPLQILWMNLVTDGLPALALAVEPAQPDVMRHLPFSPRESIFARGLGYYIIRIGIIFSIVSITLMLWSYNNSSGDPDSWKTMVFTTLCVAQMGHAIAVRSESRFTFQMNPFKNPYLLGAVIVTTALQFMLIYVEPLRNFFDTTILTGEQLVVCLFFSSLMFVWVEFEKLFIKWYKSRK
ncbi:MAG: cation-translocating P-type ATPase [Prochloraceae cyanobacterium]|nr:cation-translocating P-type ATPase [Prochloraceae cyanobacterium]